MIFSSDLKSHFKALERVIQKLREPNLKIQRNKCTLLKRDLIYLLFKISETDSKKVKIIKNMPAPRTVKQVRVFNGLTNYYRKFIKNSANVARSLTKSIPGYVCKIGPGLNFRFFLKN